MDNLTREQRRRNMQCIKSCDTSIEIKLRRALWQKGLRYRKNYKKLPGKPDIALTKIKLLYFAIANSSMEKIGKSLNQGWNKEIIVNIGYKKLRKIERETMR